MSIAIIAAVDSMQGIGHQGKLPWHYKEDLQLFKALTTGHGIIMGSRTMNSLGKLLPNREHYVLTRDCSKKFPAACRIHKNLESAVIESSSRNSHTFIIGGAEVFRQGFEIADIIYLTRIDRTYDADVYLPDIPERFKLSRTYKISNELSFEVYRVQQ